MTKNIKYIGRADSREVSEADFESLGVTEEDVIFSNGEVQELKNETADALLENLTFRGEFEELTDADVKAEEKAEEEEARLQAEADAKLAEDEGHAASGRASTTDATGTGGGTTRGGARKAAAGRGSNT